MLAVPRIDAARHSFELADAGERQAGVGDALIPLAVDAALLGADGLRELALAIVQGSAVPTLAIEEALLELERATEELGHGDASGARVDESRLRSLARALVSTAPPLAAPPQAQPKLSARPLAPPTNP